MFYPFNFLLKRNLHYRWGIVGYPNQGHPQGGDITHIQHGYPEARGQLRLQGHWSERLRVRLPQSAFSFDIWWAFLRFFIHWRNIHFQNYSLNSLRSFRQHRNKATLFLTSMNSNVCVSSSPKSSAFLRGVVVSGRGGFGGAHLHPAAGLHPHYQRPEQEVRQEVRIRWVHTNTSSVSN